MTKIDDYDLQLFLPYLLSQAAEVSSLSFQKMYKDRYGMLRTEWRVLFHLGMYGPLSAKDICERAKMHKTKISRAVRKLENRRILTRTTQKNDRRSEVLSLTPSGQATYLDLRGVAKEYEATMLSSFTDTEKEMLKNLLVRLAGIKPEKGAKSD